MHKSCVLITGGAGYIGSHANAALARAGFDTVVYDNLSYGHRDLAQWGAFVQGDILDAASLDRIFEQRRIDAVMHFAAYTYVGESVADPAKYYDNNVAGALCLLDAMRRHGVENIIFSSTCAVYGLPQGDPGALLTEEHPKQPINPYGRTKLIIEQAMEDFGRAYGLRSVILRYFNAAGADPQARVGERHIPETHLIPLVLCAASDPARTLKVFGDDYDTPDGSCVRDYIHVADLADAHVLALKHLLDGGASEAFNLGNGLGYSVFDVLDCAEGVSKRPINKTIQERRPGDSPYLVGSAQRIRSKLGWRPRFADLDKIIATAWAWHSKDGFCKGASF
ncbi:MAG: UDP-glucose 4-epimerase GalE [Desulfovibrionaceae bacterium]